MRLVQLTHLQPPPLSHNCGRGFILKLLFLVSFWLLTIAPISAESLPSNTSILTIQTREQILCETYLNTNRGEATVFGFHFDTFFAKEWYFPLIIFGAVGGQIGGYGMAGFGLGYYKVLSPSFALDITGIIGSGGGGGLAAGGGLCYEIQTGISYQVNSNLACTVKYGYLTFPNGSLTTPVAQIGFTILENQFISNSD